VTVLFVNAYGSLDMSAAVDPERWHRILSRFFDILGAAVRRHGGVVERLTGEGIKARFGAPIAHEGHAIQACEAALAIARDLSVFGQELRRSHGVSFTARMGLHSGEVLYGPVGAAGAVTASAQGYHAALASRMEQLAEPGKIYLTDHTAHLVRDFFETRDLGPFTIRGLREPLRVHELTDRSRHGSRIAASRARGFTRLVGRQAELARLMQAFDSASGNGRAKVVRIVGEAGIGKSRLTEEFARRCAARGASVRRFQSLERERLVPLGFGRRFIRTLLDIRDDDDPQTAREKAAGRLVLLAPELRDSLAVTFDVIGVAEPEAGPMTGFEARLRGIVAILKRLLDRPASSPPEVIICDDRHWTDDASEAVTEACLDIDFTSPLVVVMSYRSFYRRPWMDRESQDEIVLQRLSEEDEREMVDALLGRDPSLDRIANDLRGRCGGNPFFIEEMVRALVDNGSLVGAVGAYRAVDATSTPSLPPTLHALLAARIDALPPREKLVLETAAVVGGDFGEAVLLRASELPEVELLGALEELCRLELITRTQGGVPKSYQFSHPLMAESARRLLVRDQWRTLHAGVARAMEVEVGSVGSDQAAAIADHWERAGALLEASAWHRRAAMWAARRDPKSALAHWRKVRGFSLRLPGVAAHQEHALAACVAELELGWHRGMPLEEASACFEEGEHIARALGDTRALARLTAAWGDLLVLTGDIDQAVRFGNAACSLADGVEDVILGLTFRSRLAATLYEAGDLLGTLTTSTLRRASPDFGRSGRQALSFDPGIRLRIMRGVALIDLGSLPAGRRVLERAIAEARHAHDRFCVCVGISALPSIPRFTGELPPGLLDEAREAVALADASGSLLLEVVTRSGLGLVAHFAGRGAEARDILERALAIVGAGGVSFHYRPIITSLLGPVCLLLGDHKAALAYTRESLDALRGRRRPLREIDAILSWARVTIATGSDPPEVVAAELQRALELVASSRAHSRAPRALLLLGLAHLGSGARSAARAPLERAVVLFEAMGSQGDLRAARATLRSAKDGTSP
jgi:class 3 adenylate cyclase/tetratricopeptide (TPR) repeat protein